MPEFSSCGTSCSARSDDFEDHRWLLGQGGGACCKEQGISVESTGGSCNTKCGDRYVSSPYLFIYFVFSTYICVLLLWSFLVNDISGLVLFDLGATRSFVSIAFSKRFVDASGELDYPLEVEISYNYPVQVSRVH